MKSVYHEFDRVGNKLFGDGMKYTVGPDPPMRTPDQEKRMYVGRKVGYGDIKGVCVRSIDQNTKVIMNIENGDLEEKEMKDLTLVDDIPEETQKQNDLRNTYLNKIVTYKNPKDKTQILSGRLTSVMFNLARIETDADGFIDVFIDDINPDKVGGRRRKKRKCTRTKRHKNKRRTKRVR
jgi:hypothetical protein